MAFQAGLVHQKPLYNQQVPLPVHLQVPLYVLLKILQAPYKCYGPTCNACMALVGALPIQESALTFLAGYLTCQAVLLGCLTGPPVYLTGPLVCLAGFPVCLVVWSVPLHFGQVSFHVLQVPLCGFFHITLVPFHFWPVPFLSCIARSSCIPGRSPYKYKRSHAPVLNVPRHIELKP